MSLPLVLPISHCSSLYSLSHLPQISERETNPIMMEPNQMPIRPMGCSKDPFWSWKVCNRNLL